MVDTKSSSEGCDWPIRNVPPKDGPSEGCDWTIRKVHPRDVIGRDEDVVLKIVRRSVRRILIGRDEDVVLKIVRRSVRRILIGRDEATCPYDDASDLSSCQTDMIGQERKLVLSSGTLLIGRSDGLVLLKRF